MAVKKAAKKKTPAKKTKVKSNPRFMFLLKKSWNVAKSNWRLLGGITLIYAILYFIFSEATTAVDINQLRADVEDQLGISSTSIGGRALTASLLLQTTSSLDQNGAVIMLFVGVFATLALIWGLRFAWSGKKTSVKEAFYSGMYPVIPFFILMMRAFIQMLPLLIGSYLFSLAISRDILVGPIESFISFILLVVLPLIWSASMIIRSQLALFIVTIPNMTPSKAYAESKKLLAGRRSYAIRMLVSFGLLATLLFSATLLLAILVNSFVAILVSIALNMVALSIYTIFSYTLYRELL